MSTIQDYNIDAQALVEKLKIFFSLENGKLAGTTVSSKTAPSKHLVPVVKFLEKNKGTERLITRLRNFGFPTPTIEGSEAYFVNVSKIREITSTVVKKPTVEVTSADTNRIYSALIEWAKEKGYQNSIVAGNGFVRVQISKLTERACAFLKAKFQYDYKIECVCEDIFFEPRQKRQSVLVSPQGVQTYKDHLVNVITNIFEVPMFDTEETKDTVIVAFESDKFLKDAKDFADLCEINCEVIGTTLVFPVTETYASFDEIKKQFGTEKKIEPVTTLNEESSQISHSEFAKQVREYVKGAGYVISAPAGATNSPKPFVYSMSLKGDTEALVVKATQEKSEWQVKKVTPGSKYVHFSLIGVTSSEIAPKKEKKKVKPEVVTPTTGDIVGISLPKKIYNTVESLRRGINAPTAESKDIRQGLNLITEIGERIGLVRGSMMSKAGNARYVNWKNTPDRIKKAVNQFTQLGYVVTLTSKMAMCFKSVFPIINGQVPVENEKETRLSPKPIAENKTATKKTEPGIVTISLALTDETLQQVLKAISDGDLLNEVSARKLGSLSDSSDEELIVEAVKRGPTFLNKVIAQLYQQK